MNEIAHTQVEAFPDLVKEPAKKEPVKRHNLDKINGLLAGYGLAIDDKMETVKIKSFRRYLAGMWKGGKK